jgi:hypothetical protein
MTLQGRQLAIGFTQPAGGDRLGKVAHGRPAVLQGLDVGGDARRGIMDRRFEHGFDHCRAAVVAGPELSRAAELGHPVRAQVAQVPPSARARGPRRRDGAVERARGIDHRLPQRADQAEQLAAQRAHPTERAVGLLDDVIAQDVAARGNPLQRCVAAEGGVEQALRLVLLQPCQRAGQQGLVAVGEQLEVGVGLARYAGGRREDAVEQRLAAVGGGRVGLPRSRRIGLGRGLAGVLRTSLGGRCRKHDVERARGGERARWRAQEDRLAPDPRRATRRLRRRDSELAQGLIALPPLAGRSRVVALDLGDALACVRAPGGSPCRGRMRRVGALGMRARGRPGPARGRPGGRPVGRRRRASSRRRRRALGAVGCRRGGGCRRCRGG